MIRIKIQYFKIHIIDPMFTFKTMYNQFDFAIYNRGTIHKIPCKDCSGVCIDEAGRCFDTRLSERKRDVKPINLAKLEEDDLNKKNCVG